jgi:hypothetical protein
MREQFGNSEKFESGSSRPFELQNVPTVPGSTLPLTQGTGLFYRGEAARE